MKPTTWLYVGAVILLLLAAAGICVGGFILLGAAGGAQGVTGIGSVGVVLGVLALVAGIVMIVIAARKTNRTPPRTSPSRWTCPATPRSKR